VALSAETLQATSLRQQSRFLPEKGLIRGD
jgi:hypothetical protein